VNDEVLQSLLSRRVIFVTGKGGTGKSSIAAALALLAAESGKKVLCVEVDAKGDLCKALGGKPVGFAPRLIRPGINALALSNEESLQEYLRVYFKIPRLVRLTPLAGMFDFIATGIPGIKEVLVIGKIAYEERRVEKGAPVWDIIIVDSTASGYVLPQLGAARSMMQLTRAGMLRSQAEWVDRVVADPARTVLTICALPEEMAVTEAIELHDLARQHAQVAVAACFLNRVFPIPLTAGDVALLERGADDGKRLEARLGGPAGPLLEGVRLARRLRAESERQAHQLRARMSVPVIEIPLRPDVPPGLARTRVLAADIAGRPS
jgi:anion-transporting  ArsA/GET3 family ATPase